MKRSWAVFVLIVLVVLLPVLVQRKGASLGQADDVVVVITPHNESIRHEIGWGFREWYHAKTGRSVLVDWRTPGSTGEVLKYVDSVFVNSFRLYWERTLCKPWSSEVQMGFGDGRICPDPNFDPQEKMAVTARRAFLNSNVGCGIDVLFGGSVIEYKKEAQVGKLVDSGLLRLHPEWFTEAVIPPQHAGDRLWDAEGRWIGSSLSSFGLVFNTERLGELGYPGVPSRWEDLTHPLFFQQVAMVDPVQSSVVVRCFEMILQQQMQERLRELSITPTTPSEREHQAVREGWQAGLKIIQRLMANARYFTDNSVKTIGDISAGNCAAGIVVDFYGRYQREILRIRNARPRLEFVMPKGGSTVSPTPIALFRGAPHPVVGQAFMEYILSMEGQRLIGFKVGVPGGPRQYALSYAPVRKDFYDEENKPFMLSPEMNPFNDVGDFEYRPQWTRPTFRALRFIAKVVFMDTYNELSLAWGALIRAQSKGDIYPKALAVWGDLSSLSYDWAVNELESLLDERNPLKEIELATKLSKQFRSQYRRAYEMVR